MFYSKAQTEDTSNKATMLNSAGQSMAEMIILLILVAIIVLVAVRMFGSSVRCQYSSASDRVNHLTVDSDGCPTGETTSEAAAPPPPPPPFIPPQPPPPATPVEAPSTPEPTPATCEAIPALPANSPVCCVATFGINHVECLELWEGSPFGILPMAFCLSQAALELQTCMSGA